MGCKGMSDIKFVRITSPELIPEKYIEQIKERDWDVKRFYEYNKLIADNPLNFLFAIVNDKNEIVGVLWAMVNLFQNVFYVNTISLDKSLQRNNIIEEAVNMLKKRAERMHLNKKIIWATKRWKAFKGCGFKESDTKLMEVVWEQ